MTEIVKINLENEMDLILIHKRTMKLTELCGLSLIVQTSFATAVSEISRCVIGKNKKSVFRLGIEKLKNNKKTLIAILNTNDFPGREHQDAIKYATRLAPDLKMKESKEGTEVVLKLPVGFSGLINDAKVESFISYFKKELPLSPYDEIRKKNIQLLELSDKLRESESQYKTLTETLPLMMFTTNVAGSLIYSNKWLKDYFNLTELNTANIHWSALVHAKDTRNIRDEWEKSVNHQLNFRAQARLKTKATDDEPIWHLISLLPIRNENNQLTGWTGFFVDVHAQKIVEETLKNNVDLKAAQKQLLNSQSKLEEKIEELNKSNHDLEQFAYIASHDLQEPLRKIRTFTELLEKNINEPAKAKKFMEKIDASSSRMLNLIKGVLNYSRLSKGNSSFEEVNLNDLLHTVKQDVEMAIDEKNAKIVSTELPVISGIRQQLYQLVFNLVSNSLKFNNAEPVITISHRHLTPSEIKQHPDLHVSVNYIELIFSDNGIGFDQKYARQIFTIFSRLNGRESYAGTGIGLALCKKIVDNHHGIITAAGAPGGGAQFHVILPVS